jgi:hypothetical protein
MLSCARLLLFILHLGAGDSRLNLFSLCAAEFLFCAFLPVTNIVYLLVEICLPFEDGIKVICLIWALLRAARKLT